MSANAQDIIFKRNGDEIKAKVAKVMESEIEYKKWTNQNGPSYTMKTSEAFMIKYENGEKDIFDDNKQELEGNNATNNVNAQPDSNNTGLISKYNKEVRIATKPSDKEAKGVFPVLAVSESSVLSTNKIEINIIPTSENVKYSEELRYNIEIKNKSDKTIYIDRGNSFRIKNNESYISYYNNKQVSVTEGESSGDGVCFGIGGLGVSVGSASQNSVTQTYSQQRVLAIPPKGKANLSEFKRIKDGDNYKILTDIEHWDLGLSYRFVYKIKDGEIRRFEEEASPLHVKYMITYSDSPDFSSYEIANCCLYAKYVVGVSLSALAHGKKNYSKLVDEIQKVIPDFQMFYCNGILLGDHGYHFGYK